VEYDHLALRLRRDLSRRSAVLLPHCGLASQATPARRALMARHGGAAQPCLLNITRSRDGGHEPARDFAARFLRRGFRKVAPGRLPDIVTTNAEGIA
jgi:hypothetical protein